MGAVTSLPQLMYHATAREYLALYEQKDLHPISLTLTIATLAAFVLRHRLGILATILVLALDQAAKLAVMSMIPVGKWWPKEEFFHVIHATNLGSTLDLFSGHTIALITVSAMGIGVLIALSRTRPRTGARPQIAFGLMLAGAAGNLMDRVVFGHVTDLIDVMPWFIFNVADVAILAGFVGFAWGIPDVAGQFLTNGE